MGDPVAGNPTHYMLEKAFEIADLDWRFLTFQVSAREFEGALRGARIFGFRGIMLAPPHRGRVQPYLERLSDAVRLSRQSNCIAQTDGKLCGHNTEGQALLRLVQAHRSAEGARAIILGDRRMARSIAAELALAKAAEVRFVCEDEETIQQLATDLRDKTPLGNCSVEHWPQESEIGSIDSCDLLINAASQLRIDPEAPLPLALESLPAGAVVADLAFNPPTTRLVREARGGDLAVVDGLDLLVEQAALAFEIWTGRAPDRNAMREAVEEFLVL